MILETDEEIARLVQSGTTQAFGTLVERYEAKLARYARKFLADPDEAKDILQDVFIKAFENIQSFDASRRFSPWIYRIAHNELVNAIKKKQASRTIFTFDIDTLIPHLTAPERSDERALLRDMRDVLDRHLNELDPKYREPLILYYLESMDYNEISDVLEIPVSTVGVRLARGRAQLQAIAQKRGEL